MVVIILSKTEPLSRLTNVRFLPSLLSNRLLARPAFTGSAVSPPSLWLLGASTWPYGAHNLEPLPESAESSLATIDTQPRGRMDGYGEREHYPVSL